MDLIFFEFWVLKIEIWVTKTTKPNKVGSQSTNTKRKLIGVFTCSEKKLLYNKYQKFKSYCIRIIKY